MSDMIERDTLERWADDEFLVGHLMGVMTHSFLDLEEAIAMGSFSQDELSHCSLVCDMLDDSERQKDERFLLREPHDFRCSTLALHEPASWPESVIKHLLYEEAEKLRVEAHGGETVMVREEEMHRRHWWSWTEALSSSNRGWTALQEEIERLWPLTADLFDMGCAVDEGAWRSELERGLSGFGLKLPGSPFPFQGRSERDPSTLAELERVIRPAQSVFRQDPSATWA